MPNLCVFCGSSAGDPPVYAEAARQVGGLLVARGWGLVYGGGHVGMMGVLADAVRAAGGNVIGVIPQSLVEKELARPEIEDLRVCSSMHERKALMADLADAFLALPGGFGTLDELFEILTWAQLGFHAKPIGLLNVNDFFGPLLAWIDGAVRDGFIKEKYRELLRVSCSVEEVLQRIGAPDETEA